MRLLLRTGFQHPASAVAPERYIGATLKAKPIVAPETRGRGHASASTMTACSRAQEARPFILYKGKTNGKRRYYSRKALLHSPIGGI